MAPEPGEEALAPAGDTADSAACVTGVARPLAGGQLRPPLPHPPSAASRATCSVYNEEYRHTSLIATLRKAWDLGPAFTQRDASARTFDHVFTRGTPREPQTWATVAAQP